MATQTEEKVVKKDFDENSDLTSQQRKDFEFVTARIKELQKTREDHYGHNLDTIWSDADKDYIPHRLRTKETRIVATDETKGWRGSLVTLGSSDWQSDISQSNPFVKIQTALSILVDQNPTGIFTPLLKKFVATTELIKQLYQRSWEVAKSKAQLKLFVFNLAKYGWAVARTFPLRIVKKVKVLKEYNQEEPDKSVYEEKEVVEYNDIFRESIDPRNAWIDDMAKPNNPRSIRDWCWRKVYDMDVAEREFGKYRLWSKVKAGGITTETLRQTGGSAGSAGAVSKQFQGKNLVEVWFYENELKDMFQVHIGGVPVIMEPLPIADAKGNKRLSLWQAYWNLRHAESPYGIGIYEAVRYDQAMLDRIRNMTIDQLVLSIYKMFFYQGTQQLQNTGEITITPGVGKQVLDPKNISWLQVPGPGNEAWNGIALMRKDIDEASGITDPLLGQVTGKTAFEIAQAKESALKRLKAPLENILEALDEEAYTSIALIQLLYSIPETYEISDPQLIDDYLKEVEGDPELFGREEDEQGNAKFVAKVFPEFPLNLDKDEKGNLIETKETRFFRIKPRFLNWEGIIKVKSQSILTPSKQVEKALDLEFYNMFIPLLGTLSQERLLGAQTGSVAFDDLPHGKVAKSLAKLYDKDPRDVLPDAWLSEGQTQEQPQQPGEETSPEEPLFVNLGQGGGAVPQTPTSAEEAETVTGQTQLPERPQGLVGRIMSRITSPFRKV